MRAMARWFTAPMMSRRTRVCSGGSLKTRLVVWCSYSSESPNFGFAHSAGDGLAALQSDPESMLRELDFRQEAMHMLTLSANLRDFERAWGKKAKENLDGAIISSGATWRPAAALARVARSPRFFLASDHISS
mgnify:CR=1 FL=1